MGRVNCMPYKNVEDRKANYYKNHEKMLARGRAQHAKHKEKRNATTRTKRAANPEKAREYANNHYAENKDHIRKYHRDATRLNRSGINAKSFAHMLWKQAGLCASCTEPMAPGGGTHIDHDHACCPGKTSCGKCVRGLICRGCNHAAGLLRDSELNARGLGEYLRIGHELRVDVKYRPGRLTPLKRPNNRPRCKPDHSQIHLPLG